jgi:hypothetical protein
MTHAYALKAPVQNWKPPPWLTVHNVIVTLIVIVALLVFLHLASAIRHLSKRSGSAPAPAPKKSGGGGKLLLAVLAVVGGLLAWGHYKPAATGAKAAPAPAPSPSPHPVPTVTQTLAPPAAHPGAGTGLVAQLTAWMNHLTGTDWVLIVLIGAVATFVIVRPLLKRGD